MKCLVTGAAGFIGSHLSEALIGEGHTVVGVDCLTDYYPRSRKLANLKKLKSQKGFKFLNLDLSRASLSRIGEPDLVFHLAAQPGVRSSWGTSFSYYLRDNIAATQRLLESAKDWALTRFVFASSSSVYGDAEHLPTKEDSLPRPVSPYGATKLAAEHLCNVYYRSYGLPTVVLRYFTVYGPRQRPDMAFSVFIDRIWNGKPIQVFGDGRQERDFTFVADTVKGTILAADATKGETYNLGSGRSVSLNEVISTLEGIIGREAKVLTTGRAKGDVRMTCAAIGKLKGAVGYEPTTGLEAGLKSQVEAFARS